MYVSFFMTPRFNQLFLLAEVAVETRFFTMAIMTVCPQNSIFHKEYMQ